ncbi:Wadjet anti-phage system protein JetD domain-containing protein [Arthrobacter sp. NPDC093125]|uniref:Wadjet anti-phage system protein JetD domain-containing protein n=1 Tax=Arthrobacter sp. NPDC093125 TaxID=3363944 RepID=UPI003800C02C
MYLRFSSQSQPCFLYLELWYTVRATPWIGWARPRGSDGRVVYWGDLDSHGFGILNRVRQLASTIRLRRRSSRHWLSSRIYGE